MTVIIFTGDCRDVLRTLPDESVHCVVTSPPYWGLRSYGVPPSVWGGDPACEHSFSALLPPKPGRGNKPGDLSTSSLTNPERQDTVPRATDSGCFCRHCDAWRGAHGLEPTYQLYVENAVAIFRDVRRVLRSDGTLWLNLGDSYCSGGRATWRSGASENKGQDVLNDMPRPAQPIDLKPKDLIGIPWRVALALQADGWYLRQDIIWSKPNPMPESVTDRCTKAHEYLFLLSKSERYYFDQEAILEPCSPATHARLSQDVQAQIGSDRAHAGGKTNGNMKAVGRLTGAPHGRHELGDAIPEGERRAVARTSWKGSTFDGPRDLAVRPDTGRKRAEAGSGIKNNDSMDAALAIMPEKRNKRSVWTVNTEGYSEAHFATFPPALIEPCIRAGCPTGGVVLDPFGGAGTTGLVADRLQRNAILIELNPKYAAMARNRIDADAGMFSTTKEASP